MVRPLKVAIASVPSWHIAMPPGGGVHSIVKTGQVHAPSSVDNLRSAGFHYWALGHVHTRQQLSERPSVHYCGNLQGRNPRETGARGGLLVDLGDPVWPEVEFKEFSRVRWEKVDRGDPGQRADVRAARGRGSQCMGHSTISRPGPRGHGVDADRGSDGTVADVWSAAQR